jgi:hypothetical protein
MEIMKRVKQSFKPQSYFDLLEKINSARETACRDLKC